MPADWEASGDFVHGEGVAEDVGGVGADDGLYPSIHRPAEALDHLAGVEKPPVDNPAGHAPDVPEGPGNGVVLIAGDNHRVPGRYQAPDGDVQAVGGVGGQDDVFRCGNVEQLRRLHPAAQHQVRRHPGGGMVTPSGGGHGVNRVCHRRWDGGRLLQRSGRAVEIDHCGILLTDMDWAAALWGRRPSLFIWQFR